MGRLNGNLLRYMEKEDFRVLTAVEMGMKNHEIVPIKLIASISGVREGSAYKILGKLAKHRLVAYDSGKSFDGYRLTTLGYDYLALNSLVKQDAVYGLGSQVGVGKESDVYLVSDEAGDEMCLKLHRLGRTSFRQLKNKRDYHRHRQTTSWLYLSRLAAEMEFTFMKALYSENFPVPIPVAYNRHAVVMSVAEGYPLCQISELSDPPELCSLMMAFITRLASYGLIHCDFNEFNILVDDEDEDGLAITAIDFPQMVSINHRNAEYYFDRDVAGVRDFFSKKFGYSYTDSPKLSTIERVGSLDVELKASGYNHGTAGAVEADSDRNEGDGESDPEASDEDNEAEEEGGEGLDEKVDQSESVSIADVRAIVRKEVRKTRKKQTNRVLLQSATTSHGRKKHDKAKNMCTEDFFVKLLG